jgi:hypothetical protein
MYLGIERRATARYPGARTGAIELGPNHYIACTVRDFSTAGVGLILPAAVSILLAEFDVTLGRYICRCKTVWRQTGRMGRKVRTTRFASYASGAIGVRTRGLNIKAGAAKLKADQAAHRARHPRRAVAAGEFDTDMSNEHVVQRVSVRLHSSELHHLGPLFGLIRQMPAEFGRGGW